MILSVEVDLVLQYKVSNAAKFLLRGLIMITVLNS